MPVLLSASSRSPQRRLLGVVRAGRIAGRRPDAAILLARSAARSVSVLPARSPSTPAARARAGTRPAPRPGGRPAPSAGWRDSRRGRASNSRDLLVDADAGGHRERPDLVRHARSRGATKSARQALGCPLGLRLLLAQLVQPVGSPSHATRRRRPRCRRPPSWRGRSRCTALRREPPARDHLLQHLPRVGVERCAPPRRTTGSSRMAGNLPANSQALKNGIQSM